MLCGQFTHKMVSGAYSSASVLLPGGRFPLLLTSITFVPPTDCSTDVPLGSVTAVSGIQSLFSLDGGEDRVSKRIHFAGVISSPAKRKAQNGNGVFVV